MEKQTHKEEPHHCERCGYTLDNGHEYGPVDEYDYLYLCQTCERDLMRQHPDRYPLMQPKD